MKNIAISNIAWDRNLDEDVANLMKEFGINGLEVAPAKIISDFNAKKNEDVESFRNFWTQKDIQIVGMQSLFFGREYSSIFDGEELQNKMLQYLDEVMALSAQLGLKNLVFGSPKNRQKKQLSFDEALEVAAPFFYKAAEIGKKYQVTLCIEPNPKDYECDFINTSDEAVKLLEKVNHPNIGLHLDAAGMTLSGENIEEALNRHIRRIKHFHVSEPFLEAISVGKVAHKSIGETLKKLNYSNWISIEMRQTTTPLESIQKAFKIVCENYR